MPDGLAAAVAASAPEAVWAGPLPPGHRLFLAKLLADGPADDGLVAEGALDLAAWVVERVPPPHGTAQELLAAARSWLADPGLGDEAVEAAKAGLPADLAALLEGAAWLCDRDAAVGLDGALAAWELGDDARSLLAAAGRDVARDERLLDDLVRGRCAPLARR